MRKHILTIFAVSLFVTLLGCRTFHSLDEGLVSENPTTQKTAENDYFRLSHEDQFKYISKITNKLKNEGDPQKGLQLVTIIAHCHYADPYPSGVLYQFSNRIDSEKRGLRYKNPTSLLKKIGPKATNTIIYAVTNGDVKTRMWCAMALGDIEYSDQRKIKALITLLDDENPSVCFEAAQSAWLARSLCMAELYGSFRKGNIYAAYALWGIDSLNENIANMFYEDYVNAQTLGRQNIINALIHSGKLTDKTINIIMLGFKVGLVPQTYLTINSEKFMPAILQVLNGNDTTDKLIFIKLLKSMEPEKAAKAVPVILPMLRDKNEYIVLSSAEFLERYDIPEAKAIVQKHHEAFNKD
jgi:hypothetical protein